MRRYHLNTSHLHQLSPGYATKSIVVSISKDSLCHFSFTILLEAKYVQRDTILMFRDRWMLKFLCCERHLFNQGRLYIISSVRISMRRDTDWCSHERGPDSWIMSGVFTLTLTTSGQVRGDHWDPGAVSVSNAAFVNIIGQSQSPHPPL